MTDPNAEPLVVLDDDPTGFQTLHHGEVVFDVTSPLPQDDLARPGAVTFLLANTRSMGAPRAEEVYRRLAVQVASIDEPVTVVSRGDSTLRGHTVLECRVLQEAFAERQRPFDAVVFAPAFFEAGRRTVRGRHEVLVDGSWQPVAETEYAMDPTFGFEASHLVDHLVEVSGGRITAADVTQVTVDDLDRGLAAVADRLATAPPGGWVTVDGRARADYDLVVAATRERRRRGARFLFRAGPSMLQSLAAQDGRPQVVDCPGLLHAAGRGAHGLVVVGSHTARTTEQLNHLAAGGGVTRVELEVDRVGEGGHLEATARAVRDALTRSVVVMHTSRTLRTGKDRDDSLALSVRVSDAVSTVVQQSLSARPAFVMGKGGITSNEVARVGCGIRRAELVGPLLPGHVSVVRATHALPDAVGMPYVIFPGNVGAADALSRAVDRATRLTTLTGRPAGEGAAIHSHRAPRATRA